MCQSPLTDEIGKVLRDELAPVVRDHPWPGTWKFLQRSFNHQLDIVFFHLHPQLMMNNVTGEAVDDSDQKQERAPEIDVFDIRVPMLVNAGWLLKTASFCRFFLRIPPVQQP